MEDPLTGKLKHLNCINSADAVILVPLVRRRCLCLRLRVLKHVQPQGTCLPGALVKTRKRQPVNWPQPTQSHPPYM